MRFTFTAATERALAFASDWCSRTGREELDAESLLVGLLSESECRAAVMLAKHGVDIAAVCRNWPSFAPPSSAPPVGNRGETLAVDAPHGGKFQRIPFSSDVDVSIQSACDRLDFLPRRPELATEHLLLGLVSTDHEVATWLRQRGLDPDAIEAEIRGLYGYVLPETPESEEPSSEREESMYERFTDRARKIMQLANQEAQRFNHEYIGTEHILLGLIKEGSGVAASVLKNLDVDLRKIRLEVEKLIQCGPKNAVTGKLPQTPRAKKVIEFAMEEAQSVGHSYVGSEHILLGLLREQEGVAAQILRNFGLSLEDVRNETLALLAPGINTVERRIGLPDTPDIKREDSLHERFTDRARKVFQLANQEAQRFNHEYIGTEHILLGLIKEGSGVAANVLKNLEVDLRKIRLEVEKLVQSGPDMVTMGKLPQTPRAKKVIEYSMEEARNLNHNYVGTEHVLLGLLREQEGVAAQVLMNLGLKLEVVREEVLNLLGHRLESASRPIGLPITSVAPSGPLAGCITAIKEKTGVLRVLDAAANRAREGLRVIEDYARFVLDDRHLTELCKQLRHNLTAALSQVSTDRRMAARETLGDVGTVLSTPSELRRDDMNSVVRANFARLQESLRSLEEFHKLAEPEIPDVFKQLRYRTYTLERAVEITRGSIERLAKVRLYVLVEGRDSPEEFERLVVSLIQAGVHAIQLRDKQLGDRDLLARARLLRALTWETPALCIINDRPDLAALAGADGVHVGQEEISVKDARQIVGTAALVGVSTHSIEQARQAVLDGANYIGVGPTSPSDTKTFEQFPGLDLLKAVAAEIRLPAFAIGGIKQENIADVLAAGFTRVAVSGAVAAAPDPAAAARELLAILNT